MASPHARAIPGRPCGALLPSISGGDWRRWPSKCDARVLGAEITRKWRARRPASSFGARNGEPMGQKWRGNWRLWPSKCDAPPPCQLKHPMDTQYPLGTQFRALLGSWRLLASRVRDSQCKEMPRIRTSLRDILIARESGPGMASQWARNGEGICGFVPRQGNASGDPGARHGERIRVTMRKPMGKQEHFAPFPSQQTKNWEGRCGFTIPL